MPRERTSCWIRDMKVAQSWHIEAGHGVGNSRQSLTRELPLSLNCTLMTDSTQLLSGFTTSKDSLLDASITFHAEYPDPYLELSLKCQYHDKPPPSELEEDVHAGLDERVSEQGYRTSYEGCLKLTSWDVKALRLITLEVPNDQVGFNKPQRWIFLSD
ncbi:hypothetical protein N7528_006801 [Penicillium herquei]|nr:hypothetical protein N7528_006801 [Penicillium herquei]